MASVERLHTLVETWRDGAKKMLSVAYFEELNGNSDMAQSLSIGATQMNDCADELEAILNDRSDGCQLATLRFGGTLPPAPYKIEDDSHAS